MELTARSGKINREILIPTYRLRGIKDPATSSHKRSESTKEIHRQENSRYISARASPDMEISPIYRAFQLKAPNPNVPNFRSGWLDAYQLTSAVNVPIKTTVQRCRSGPVQTPRRPRNSQVSMRYCPQVKIHAAGQNCASPCKHTCTRRELDFRGNIYPDFASTGGKKCPNKHSLVFSLIFNY